MDITTWQKQISMWYKERKHDQVERLEMILYSVPDSVFGPEISDTQSKALAYWLDGCLRVFQQTRYQDHHKAYHTLLYTCAKLEKTAYLTSTDVVIKDWCLKRLQTLTVLALEFCNQQRDDPDEWQQQANNLIEAHIVLMSALNWNETGKNDQGRLH